MAAMVEVKLLHKDFYVLIFDFYAQRIRSHKIAMYKNMPEIVRFFGEVSKKKADWYDS